MTAMCTNVSATLRQPSAGRKPYLSSGISSAILIVLVRTVRKESAQLVCSIVGHAESPPDLNLRRLFQRSQFSPVVAKRDCWVRLNGADHQWGKNPPKEVVG